MTPQQLTNALAAIRYKPGWTLSWDWNYDDGFIGLWWRFSGFDADTGHPRTWTTAKIILEDWIDEEGLIRAVFDQLKRAEEHECMEFFRYKGAKPFDPHKSILANNERWSNE